MTVYVYAAADEYHYQNNQSILAISGGFTANPPTERLKLGQCIELLSPYLLNTRHGWRAGP